MKRKIGGFLFCLTVALGVSGCTAVVEEVEVEAKGMELFDIIGYQEDVGEGLADVLEARHKVTGCHYLVSSYQNENIEQMYDATGKPYCTENK